MLLLRNSWLPDLNLLFINSNSCFLELAVSQGDSSYPRIGITEELINLLLSSDSIRRGNRRIRDRAKGQLGVTTHSQLRRFGEKHF